MPDLHTDESGVAKEFSNSPQAIPKGSRKLSLTIAWAAAALVATCGWIYFIFLVGHVVTSWFSE